MQVKLISYTNDPISLMWTAARTCYNPGSPIDMWKELGFDISKKAVKIYQNSGDERDAIDYCNEVTNKHWKLVKTVLDSGHQSIAEHVYFTFAIEGISRACSHQLVRHRHCTFSQQSQRYVEIKEDMSLSLIEGKDHDEKSYLEDSKAISLLDKYFIWDHNNYAEFHSLINSLYCYLCQVRDGIKPEDARAVLPNATKTNLVMTCNLAELMHICNLRLCTRAQKEIRDLFKEIVKCVEEVQPKLAELLVPQCDSLGFCTEHKCCGRNPKIEDIKSAYKKQQDFLNDIQPILDKMREEELTSKCGSLKT